MSEELNLDYITNNLSQLTEKLDTAHKRVKHGKLKVQRRKVKSQVMKDHKPADHKREEICKKAREKAHTSVANARRNISNDVRRNIKEGLKVVNPSALTLSESYGFDFIEEACAFTPMDMEVTFFEKAEVTSVSESLDFGKTASGRKRKGKAIGIAEGVFAPIEDVEGNSVFSRNKRLYESGFWGYQLENANLTDRVSTRRMLGTIGHYDKKVDDKDLAEGKVSHVVTNLEIREDYQNGRYLWGRLEILNTPAGRLLKEYYDNEIPLFVSSRGGGKLLDVPGKDYKMVDKDRYYCETFDVVKEPGFLEACPEYHSESLEETVVSENIQNEVITEENEDINMSEQVKCDIKASDSMEEIVKKVINPMNETLSKLTALVEQMHNDMYETVAEAEEEAEAPAVEEPKAEEAPVEEAPAEEKVEEAVEEAKKPCEKCGKEECECEKEEKKEDCEKCSEEAEEEKAEEAPVEEPAKEEAPAEPVAEEAVEEPSEEKAEEVVAEEAEEKVEEEPKAEEQPAEEVAEQPVEEAVEEPKAEEEIPAEEPAKEEAPVEEPVAEAEEEKVEEEPKAEEPAEEVPAEPVAEAAEEEQPAEVETEEVVDYQAMYEQIKSEVDEAVKQIEDLTEMFRDLGKKHKEVVVESEQAHEQLEAVKKELNSYKLSEKFNITIEEASEMLSSKSYETVEEELTEVEAKNLEDEAQAKAEQVSESVSEPESKEAPVSRKIFSAFSTESEVSEAVEAKAERKIFSWFN